MKKILGVIGVGVFLLTSRSTLMGAEPVILTKFFWEISITYPDKEKKMFVADPKGGKISLRDSKWDCDYSSGGIIEGSESMNISCGVIGKGEIYTMVFPSWCGISPRETGKKSFFSLGESTAKKVQNHHISVTCR